MRILYYTSVFIFSLILFVTSCSLFSTCRPGIKDVVRHVIYRDYFFFKSRVVSYITADGCIYDKTEDLVDD